MKRFILILIASALLFTACNYDDDGVFEYVLASEPTDNRALNIIGSVTPSGDFTTIYFKSRYGLESFNNGTYATLDSSNAAKSSTIYSLVGDEYIVYITQDTNSGSLSTPINGLYIYNISSGSREAASSTSLTNIQALPGKPLFVIKNFIYFVVKDSSTSLTYLQSYEISVSGTDVTLKSLGDSSLNLTASSYGFYDIDGNILTYSNSSSVKKYVALDESTGKVSSTLLSSDDNGLPSGKKVTTISGFNSGTTQYVILQNDDDVQIFKGSDSSFTRIHSRDITASSHLYTYFNGSHIFYNIPGYAGMYKVVVAASSSTSKDYTKLKNLSIAGYFKQSDSSNDLIIATRDNGFYLLKEDLSSLKRY
ncbi:MAG: hypothetical protein IJ836_04755 [Spirochaetales bacterium]|nr:hypothetical protein [Spirochaetales bacterium]